jgi:hypothetical protein
MAQLIEAALASVEQETRQQERERCTKEMQAKALIWFNRCLEQGFSGDRISSILEDFGLNDALRSPDPEETR